MWSSPSSARALQHVARTAPLVSPPAVAGRGTAPIGVPAQPAARPGPPAALSAVGLPAGAALIEAVHVPGGTDALADVRARLSRRADDMAGGVPPLGAAALGKARALLRQAERTADPAYVERILAALEGLAAGR